MPALALHLSAARHLVEKLLEARKIKEQYATVCEIRNLSGPGSSSEKPTEAPPSPPAGRAPAPSAGVERKTFRLEIVCSPEVLYEYVRLLSIDDWLFLLQDLTVRNLKQEFPPRSEIAKKFSLSDNVSAEGDGEKKAGPKKLLEILAGDESLVAQLEIDFVVWKNPEGAPPQKAP